jgi:hypothetical protein
MQARSRFCARCAQAKDGPVFIQKAGQLDTVDLSVAQYESLTDRLDSGGVAARRKAFEAEFRAWITGQIAWVETNGMPGGDLRPW